MKKIALTLLLTGSLGIAACGGEAAPTETHNVPSSKAAPAATPAKTVEVKAEVNPNDKIVKQIVTAFDAIDSEGGADTVTCAKLAKLESRIWKAQDKGEWTMEQQAALSKIDSNIYQMDSALGCA